MRLFSKQPRMYAGLGVFSAYGEPYMWKKPQFPRGPKHTTMEGLKNSLDHENLKILHEIGRGGHEKLHGSNGIGFHWTMLREFVSKFLSSNALCWVNISNGMNFFYFFHIIQRC